MVAQLTLNIKKHKKPLWQYPHFTLPNKLNRKIVNIYMNTFIHP